MGITTIWADQNAPEPALPHAVLNIISGPVKRGHDEQIQTQDMTRAKSIRVTPTPAPSATYTIQIGATAYTFVSPPALPIEAIVTAQQLGEAGEVYTVTLDGAPISYTLSDEPTWEELQAGLIAAIIAEGYVAVPTGLFSVKVTAPGGATFTISISANLSKTQTLAYPTAADITAGLDAAMSEAPQVVTDNAGTLDITGADVFAVTVTSNLSWRNLDAGHEITLTATGQRQITVSVHVLGPGALAAIETAQARLGLQSVIDALLTGGLAVIDAGPIQNLTAIANARRIDRRQMDVRFSLVSTAAEDTGYITKAHVEAPGLGVDQTIGVLP